MNKESYENILLELGDDVESYNLSDFSDFTAYKDRPKAEPQGIEVCAYDKYGKFLGLYKSTEEAARAFKVSTHTVYCNCKGTRLNVLSKDKMIFLYRGKDIDERLKAIDEIRKARGNRKVEENSLAGRLVYVWDCIKDVCKHYGYAVNNVSNCVNGRKLHIDNHIFAYDNSDIKARVKEIRRKRALKLLKRPKCIPVDAYSIEGEFLKAFPSASAASKEYNIHVSLITRCCKGVDNRQKPNLTCHNMIFLYPGNSISERLELIKEKRK